MTKPSPFRYFKTSPEIIQLAVMLYVRFPLSLRNVEDLLHERGIDVRHETIRFWWNRFGPMFAKEIRRKRIQKLRAYSNWQWHLDEVFVKINGETHYLWWAVDHEGEVLESYVTKRRNRKSALKFLRKTMKRYGSPNVIVTDRLRSYGAAMKVIGNADKQEVGRWKNRHPKISRPVGGSHTRFYHRYHVVWVTKYRYKVVRGPMRERIREIIRQTCRELGVHIEKGVLSRDHVHMFISVPPHLALSKVMQRIKGRSSYKIQREFPELRKRYWGQRFWARGYFSTTSGNVTDDIIRQYLELHSKREPTDVSR